MVILTGMCLIVRHKVGIGLALVFVLLLGCEAERDNPLDPNSLFYGGKIAGWVKTRVGEPVSGAKVFVDSEGSEDKICLSDKEGYYEIRGLVGDSCMMIVSKEGYSCDSIWVEPTWGDEDTVNFFLDILPIFVSCGVSTHFLSEGDDKFARYAFFETGVFDGDGPVDVEFISCWIEDFPDTFLLEYDPGSQVYRKIIYHKELPEQSLDGIIGKNCFFAIRDKAGEEVVSPPVRAARIIYDRPELVWPVKGTDVEDPNPQLVWRKVSLSYPHTYKVEVKSDEPVETVWSQDGIASSDTTVTVPVSLSMGYYTWAIWVVDEFGDSSKSDETGFDVIR